MKLDEIILKDNFCSPGSGDAFMLDKEDSSITRSLPYLLTLIRETGVLQVVGADDPDEVTASRNNISYQADFPDSIFPVPMIGS